MAQLFKPLGDCFSDVGVPTLACAGTIIQNIVTALLTAAAIGTLFMLILGGIKYALSGGDPKKVQAARSTITYAIIGVALAFFAFLILNLLSTITGNKDITNSNLRFVKPSFPSSSATARPSAPVRIIAPSVPPAP